MNRQSPTANSPAKKHRRKRTPRKRITKRQIMGARSLVLRGIAPAMVADQLGIKPKYLVEILRGRERKSLGLEPIKIPRRKCHYGEPRNCWLSPDAVREIHAKGARGIPAVDVAREYKCSPDTVKNILTGRTWGHLGLKKVTPTKGRQGGIRRISIPPENISLFKSLLLCGWPLRESAKHCKISEHSAREIARSASWTFIPPHLPKCFLSQKHTAQNIRRNLGWDHATIPGKWRSGGNNWSYRKYAEGQIAKELEENDG